MFLLCAGAGLVTASETLKYANGSPAEIPDAGVTNSAITIADHGRIRDLRVEIRADHGRVADLEFTLVSPVGKRVVLARNRGADGGFGFGTGTVSNDVEYTGFTDDTNLSPVSIASGVAPFTNAPDVSCNVVLDDGFEAMPFPLLEPFGLPPGFIVSGWEVVAGDVDVIGVWTGPPYSSYSGRYAVDLNGNFPGAISTNLSLLPGVLYRVSLAYSTVIPATTALITLAGTTNFTITAASLQWFTTQFVFTAVSANTTLRAESITPGGTGLLVDAFRIEEVARIAYFEPEEPLSVNVGDDAFGAWTLEVRDTQTGGTAIPAQLLGWRLEIDYAPPVLTPQRFTSSDNGPAFRWLAPTSHVFQVEFTDSLPAHWQTFARQVSATNGVFRFIDDTNTNGVQRFYRVRHVN